MRRLQILSLVIFIGLSFGCSDEDCCVNTDISSLTKNMADLGCMDAPTSMMINANEAYLIITNREDYDTFVEGTCHPDIDFSQYQLIIGYFISKKKVLTFDYKYYMSCENNFYKLSVSPAYATGEENSENTMYFYQILVPNDETIDFLRVSFSDSQTKG